MNFQTLLPNIRYLRAIKSNQPKILTILLPNINRHSLPIYGWVTLKGC